MAVGTVSGVNLDEQWQLIATNTMSGSTTTTFSSLSGYKTYIVVNKNMTQSTTGIAIIRFNGDSTVGNYGSTAFWDNSQMQYLNNAIAAWGYAGGGAGAWTNWTVIKNADSSSMPKTTESRGYLTHMGSGIWTSLSPITSITFSATAGVFTGTVELWGIPA